MATLEELLSDYGLSEPKAQTKTAAAQPVKNEVEEVLEGLGLDGAEAGVEKVANETDNKGDRMSLTGIYEELFGEQAPAAAAAEPAATTEKTASEEVNEATQLFGELTAHYFGVAQGQFLDKVAGSLESEANGQDEEQPMKHLDNKSQLGSTLGAPADPHLPLNHSASGGKPSTGIGEPETYSLKDKVMAKQILKRLAVGIVGNTRD